MKNEGILLKILHGLENVDEHTFFKKMTGNF